MSVLGWMRAFYRGAAELLLLRDAERISTSYGDERAATVRREARRARQYLRAARRVANPDLALSMLDIALPAALASAEAAWGQPELAGARDEVTRLADQRAAARDFAEKDSIRGDVEDLVARVLSVVESRSVLEIRALRWGRVCAIVLAVVFVAQREITMHFLVHNVALHKPVTSSTLQVQTDTSELVDGKTRGTFAIHTATSPRAFVMVDLSKTYDVREVRIYNRGDGWFDDVIPLALSTSVDGTTFQDVATRTTHFDVWTVDLGGRPARYIRVGKDGYIALNEIEVYARE
jgi:hypothetical protein